jgi:hypothetical protein
MDDRGDNLKTSHLEELRVKPNAFLRRDRLIGLLSLYFNSLQNYPLNYSSRVTMTSSTIHIGVASPRYPLGWFAPREILFGQFHDGFLQPRVRCYGASRDQVTIRCH